MSDTFDLDPATLPTTTKTLRNALTANTVHENALVEPLATTQSTRALLDAVYALEQRIVALHG